MQFETKWTREGIIDAMQRFKRKHGRPPKSLEWSHATAEHPCFATVRERFGSWNKGVVAAGLEPRACGRSFIFQTNDQLLAAIHDYAAIHHKLPPYNRPMRGAAVRLFGSWEGALVALIVR